MKKSKSFVAKKLSSFRLKKKSGDGASEDGNGAGPSELKRGQSFALGQKAPVGTADLDIDLQFDGEGFGDQGPMYLWSQPSPQGDIPAARFAHTVTVAGNSIVVIGGYDCIQVLDDIHVLDCDKMQWFVPDCTGDAPGSLSGHTANFTRGLIYIIGGFDGTQDLSAVHTLDVETWNWTLGQTTGQGPQPRQGHTTSALGSRMFVFGGNNPQHFFSDMKVLEVPTMTWSEPTVSGSVPCARSRHTASAVGNKIVLFGGFDGSRDLDDLHVLYTDTMIWQKINVRVTPSSPSPRCRHTATLVDSDLFIFGGYQNSCRLNDVYVLDTITMAWSKPSIGGTHPAARSGHTTSLVGRKLWVFGGWGGRTILNDLNVLDIVNRSPKAQTRQEAEASQKSQLDAHANTRIQELLDENVKLLNVIEKRKDETEKLVRKQSQAIMRPLLEENAKIQQRLKDEEAAKKKHEEEKRMMEETLNSEKRRVSELVDENERLFTALKEDGKIEAKEPALQVPAEPASGEPPLSEDEKKQLFAALEKQKAKIKKLQGDNHNLAEKLQKLSSTSKLLVKENEAKEQQYEEAKKQIELLKSQATDAAATVSSAESDEMKVKIASLTADLAAKSSAVEASESQVASLKQQLEGSQSEVAAVKKQNGDLSSQLEEALNRKLSEGLVRAAGEVLNKSKLIAPVMGQLKDQSKAHITALTSDFDSLSSRLISAVNASAKAAMVAERDRNELLELYQQEVQKRKKIYNQLQDLRGTLRVYCRVRPLVKGHDADGEDDPENEGYCQFPGDDQLTIRDKNDAFKRFDFDRVFNFDSTQTDVFADTQPLITSVADGYNVCIFAYGQTGSGKTHTMGGPKSDPGISVRALQELFSVLEERKSEEKHEVKISLLEIYNEQIRDLLTTDWDGKKYDVFKDDFLGMHCPDLVEQPVSNTEDVLKALEMGQTNRAVGSTNANEHSSRSHMLLRVLCHVENLTTGEKTLGKMTLVDLAGSERLSKSEAQGDRLNETKHINKSLSALGDVVSGLANDNPHIPYRNSKLTYLLQDSLGGNSKTLMFVNLSPLARDCSETLCRAKTVYLGQAKKNVNSKTGKSPGKRAK